MKSSSNRRSTALILFFGGILPVIAFTIVEEYYGIMWGTVAGMVFGIGEVLFEKFKNGRVAGITWFSNAMILVLGGVSLIANDGVWFKMQPAILLYVFGFAVVGSSFMNKPVMLEMTLKQNPNLPEHAVSYVKGLNTRLGLALVAMGALSTWAALAWSTEAWAFLKSIGVMIILAAYFGGEIAFRKWIKPIQKQK
ncbi:MAG TPA: septation protein IspZ [Bdellovibrionales bacterium]|jgi:intracellular septation protein|nr:septation protein IspZ [Bdellovibrionales bacterium]